MVAEHSQDSISYQLAEMSQGSTLLDSTRESILALRYNFYKVRRAVEVSQC